MEEIMPASQAIKRPRAMSGEAIYEVLRRDIALGRLMPRQRLVESDLCERFGASNHNVRRAFELLDRIGLIDRKANRGVEVKALSTNELKDLYDIRSMLQAEGVRRLDMDRIDELVDQLTKINNDYEVALREDRIEAAVDANDLFHTTQFEYCKNAELASLQLNYWLRASAIISRALMERGSSLKSLQDHWDIIAALRNRDMERLVELTVTHIRPPLAAYMRVYGLY